MERFFCGSLENLPEVQPIEIPAHKKKQCQFVPRPKPDESAETLWSSLSTTTKVEEPEPCFAVPSPLLHVDCGGSEASTTPHTNKKRPLHQKGTEGQEKESPVKSKRCLIPTSSSPISVTSISPLKDEIVDVLFYGSEEDSDDDDEREVNISVPVVVPRTARLYFEQEDMLPKNMEVNLEWPPNCHSEVAKQCDPASIPASTPGMEPCSKFDFKWRAFSDSQIDPNLRREPFSDINCGPTVLYASPYEAFTAIWDREILEHIALETNRYAQEVLTAMMDDGTMSPNSRITDWTDTNPDELYVFFAIMLATGIVVKSSLDEYWHNTKDIFCTVGFSAVMSYRRFHLLSKCLHFQNKRGCNPNVMKRSEAKLFKLQPILDHLNIKFSQLYNLSQNIAIDESLTMWKGLLDINQFIYDKATKVGIRTYEICEPRTGYLWRFEVHGGHDNPNQSHDPISGTVPTLVLTLLNSLEHKGHTVWMDNFYNSPAFARELKFRGFDCVGTLRTSQKFVPSEFVSLTKNQMRLGQVYGCTSGDVDLIVWREKNRVALISTYHGLATVKSNDKVKSSVAHDYNICMGGVDRKDQMIAMYPIERGRSQVWYKKFFRRLLNVSVLNAYILLKHNATISHRSFRKTLVLELIAKHSALSSKVAPPITPGHFPAQFDFFPENQRERQKRPCAYCTKRTTSYCKECNVPLCVFTCFEPFHAKKKCQAGTRSIQNNSIDCFKIFML